MKTKRENKEFSADELNRAVRKFLKDGGIIEKLPDQKSALFKRVGGKWATTELGSDTI